MFDGPVPPEASVRLLPPPGVHPEHPYCHSLLALILDSQRGRPRAHYARGHHRAHHGNAVVELSRDDDDGVVRQGD